MSTATLSRRNGQASDNDDQSIESKVDAIASLPQNLAILKMENDSIQALAAARPRDMTQIKKDLEDTLAAFPDLAYEAIYSKPVGKCIDVTCVCGHVYEAALKRDGDQASNCPRCHSDEYKHQSTPHQKFARGLSVRSAETLAEAYGFNRVRADLMPAENGAIKIEATFTDYQRGRIWQDSNIVSPFYRGRNGQMQRTPDDRFYNTTVKAEKSKLIREVINRSVHPGLKAWWEATCERIQGELLTDEVVSKTITAFASFGLYQQDLERIVGKPKSVGWTKTDRKTLVELYNGLKSGDVTVAELLEPEDTKPVQQQSQQQTVGTTGADLTNPTLVTEQKVEQTAETPTQSTSSATEPAKSAEPPKTENKPLPQLDLASLAPRFAACKSLTAVGELMKELRPMIPPDQREAVGELEDNARHRISVDQEAAKKKK